MSRPLPSRAMEGKLRAKRVRAEPSCVLVFLCLLTCRSVRCGAVRCGAGRVGAECIGAGAADRGGPDGRV
jgi:hypothetical protein